MHRAVICCVSFHMLGTSWNFKAAGNLKGFDVARKKNPKLWKKLPPHSCCRLHLHDTDLVSGKPECPWWKRTHICLRYHSCCTQLEPDGISLSSAGCSEQSHCSIRSQESAGRFLGVQWRTTEGPWMTTTRQATWHAHSQQDREITHLRHRKWCHLTLSRCLGWRRRQTGKIWMQPYVRLKTENVPYMQSRFQLLHNSC